MTGGRPLEARDIVAASGQFPNDRRAEQAAAPGDEHLHADPPRATRPASRLPAHDLLDRIDSELDPSVRYEAAMPSDRRIRANLGALMQAVLNIDQGRYPTLGRLNRELAKLAASGKDAPDEAPPATAERIGMQLGRIGSVLGLAGPSLHAQAPRPSVPDRLYGYRVVKSYPHDTGAFTEGLQYQDGGFLFESTGLVGRSFIRKSRLETGQVLLQRELKGPYFGEGMVTWKDKVVQLTWQHQIGFVYGASDLKLNGSFKYPGEG